MRGCFKQRTKVIDELAARSEGFRDLCDDFEIASNEEERWRRSSAPERDERIAEYTELIEIMRIEIEQTLEGASMMPFKPPRR